MFAVWGSLYQKLQFQVQEKRAQLDPPSYLVRMRKIMRKISLDIVTSR